MTDRATCESRIRAALTNDLDWHELTAGDAQGRIVFGALTAMLDDIKGQMSARNSQYAQMKAHAEAGQLPRSRFTEFKTDYLAWLNRVHHLRRLLARRQAELRERFGGPPGARPDSNRSHRERTQRQALERLAVLIYLHQSEQVTDADLYGALDEIELPMGAFGDLSLRAAVEKWWLTEYEAAS